MKRKNIALLLIGVTNENCGGAERFFANFFRVYRTNACAEHNLFFFTDERSLSILKKIGKLEQSINVVVLKNVSNRLKRASENLNLLKNIFLNRIDIIHVTSYGRNYYDRLKFAGSLPNFIRPKISVNIVDCEIPYVLSDDKSTKHIAYKLKYFPLFKEVKINGIFSWNELFIKFVREKNFLKENVNLESAKTRFADTDGFVPSAKKENNIVFAARLTEQKRPLMFIDSVKILANEYPQLIKDWKFFIYGKGVEEEKVKKLVIDYQLTQQIIIESTTDLKNVFALSKCFVSTQDYENFPSLSMNEAMSAGNAIVSRNVGQTNLFVNDGVNGYLAKEDTARGIAIAIKEYISNEKNHVKMQDESIRLTKDIHTPENFIKQIDDFWNKLK